MLLADDHSGTREGLQVILERSEEFEVVGQARDGVEAVKAASELSPDLIVMDVMMPKMDGVEACREIMESLPKTRELMLTASTEANAVIEAVAAGAAGYLQKVAGMDQVLGMMKSAAAGEGRLPTEVVRRVFHGMRSGARAKDVNLTQREKEILVSFCRGMSCVAIAAARGVKVVTVRNPSTPFRSSWASTRSRRSWCGLRRTGCWMIDGMGRFRGSGAGPVCAPRLVPAAPPDLIKSRTFALRLRLEV